MKFLPESGKDLAKILAVTLVLGTSLRADTPAFAPTWLALWRVPLMVVCALAGPFYWLLAAFAVVHVFKSNAILRERYADKLALAEAELQNLDLKSLLVKSERELRAVFDNAAAGVVEFDLTKGRLSRVNQVFCTLVGHSEEELLGGFDLSTLTFPEDRPAEAQRWAKLRATGKSFQVERRYLRPNGEIVWAHVSVAVFNTDAEGRPSHVVSILQDVTERHEAEVRIVHLAYHDPLTDLPNRAMFRIRLDQALALVARGQSCAVLCLDLDRFKDVNDTWGHPVGDALLQSVTRRLAEATRGTDVVARLGGDEFAIIQTGIETAEEAAALAERLIATLSKSFDLGGLIISIGASVGIALAPDDGCDHDSLLSGADMALYVAKRAGRGSYRFFEHKMDTLAQAKRAMEADLRRAVSEEAFELFYQPIIDISTRALLGFEALVRWHHPTRGVITPDDFIPLAEAIGLISPIGAWVLRNACAEAAKWPETLRVAVNLSPLQFASETLIEDVTMSLGESGLDPRRLELEITETAMLLETDATVSMLHRFKALGIAIAMDDFGTGYSSLGYLHRFPFDRIKIDRSFIANLGISSESAAIIRAVTGMCSSLNMGTTGEGVESESQLAALAAMGCQEAQGYYFSRPVAANAVAAVIARLDSAECASDLANVLCGWN